MERAHRLDLFASPIIISYPEGLEQATADLRELLLAEAKREPGVIRSNRQGWHSIPNLSQREQPCYRRLMQTMVDAVGGIIAALAEGAGLPETEPHGFGVQAWAMVMERGGYSVLHDHAESHWSAIYYVDAGDSDLDATPTSGQLTLVGPPGVGVVLAGGHRLPSTFEVRPETGMLIVFPGATPHYVQPYQGSRPRVSVAANITLGS